MHKQLFHFHRTLLVLLLFGMWGAIEAQESKYILYFDEFYKEISCNQFKKKIESGNYLSIPGNPPNSFMLVERATTGSLTNPYALYQFLSKAIDIPLDTNKPIAIFYHPGKDACNSSGASNPQDRTKWFLELEEGLQGVGKVQTLYLYKDSSGLESFNQLISWKKDPETTIERLFFKHHYPCGSFVVLSGKGDYISYFGEYPKEFVWNAAQILSR